MNNLSIIAPIYDILQGFFYILHSSTRPIQTEEQICSNSFITTN